MPDSAPSPEAIGYALCDDMIFTSRITGTAQTLGLKIKPARSLDSLRTLVAQQSPRCVIIDLANPSLNLAALFGFLKESGAATARVVAYGSHVDTASLQAAREAGCNPVLPRSRFIEELPQALPEWMGVQSGAPDG
jgi:DNA-binding NarL/FixJ family response regulator